MRVDASLRTPWFLIHLAMAFLVATPYEVSLRHGPDTLTFSTNFSAQLCNQVKAHAMPHLNASRVAQLREGIVRHLGAKSLCVIVFGVLVASGMKPTKKFDNNAWTLLMGNTLAEILDRDKDGRADDAAVVANMQTGTVGRGAWICAFGDDSFETDDLYMLAGGCVPLTKSEDFDDILGLRNIQARLTEEILHTWHQYGLARTYPSLFGVHSVPSCTSCKALRAGTDFDCSRGVPSSVTGCNYSTSAVLRCAYHAACNYYTEEVICSSTGSSASGAELQGGPCAAPGCLGVEWYYKVMMAWSGQGAIFSSGHDGASTFPRHRSQIDQKLASAGAPCADLLRVLRLGSMSQLQSPLTYAYPKHGVAIWTHETAHSSTWRVMIYAGLVGTIGIIGSIYGVHMTRRWCFDRGREDVASVSTPAEAEMEENAPLRP